MIDNKSKIHLFMI